MRKGIAAGLLILLSILLSAQERIARGFVIDVQSRASIGDALVNVFDTTIVSFTDKTGAFRIVVPKKRRHLLVGRVAMEADSPRAEGAVQPDVCVTAQRSRSGSRSGGSVGRTKRCSERLRRAVRV